MALSIELENKKMNAPRDLIAARANATGEPRRIQEEEMDLRLKQWGKWSRAGMPDPCGESGPGAGIGMTRDQVQSAWKMQCMVMRLPMEIRLVVNVHYVTRSPDMSKMVEVNKRLRAVDLYPISAPQFDSMRVRALQILLNSEKILTIHPLKRI